VIGLEPYLPSWGTGAIESFVRAGYRMGPSDVVLVRDLSEPVQQDPMPDGYEIVEVEPAPEYDADVFGYHALRHGRKAAHCYARCYPHLLSPSGQAIGQIGNVTTEPEHRNRGLARTMVQMSLARLAEKGAGEALIATGLENGPALHAYERTGYRRRYLITEWMKDL
jgi:ribosomal protein S18 acetylase RimI-like enzyme